MMIINIIIILYPKFFNFKTEVRFKNVSMVLSVCLVSLVHEPSSLWAEVI